MIYKANIDGIKLDVQSVNATISNEVKLQIKRIIIRLKRHISEINWVAISLRKGVKHSTVVRTAGMRLGIPANDVFASATGTNWKSLLKRIEYRLEKQLKKRNTTQSNKSLK